MLCCLVGSPGDFVQMPVLLFTVVGSRAIPWRTHGQKSTQGRKRYLSKRETDGLIVVIPFGRKQSQSQESIQMTPNWLTVLTSFIWRICNRFNTLTRTAIMWHSYELRAKQLMSRIRDIVVNIRSISSFELCWDYDFPSRRRYCIGWNLRVNHLEHLDLPRYNRTKREIFDMSGYLTRVPTGACPDIWRQIYIAFYLNLGKSHRLLGTSCHTARFPWCDWKAFIATEIQNSTQLSFTHWMHWLGATRCPDDPHSLDALMEDMEGLEDTFIGTWLWFWAM